MLRLTLHGHSEPGVDIVRILVVAERNNPRWGTVFRNVDDVIHCDGYLAERLNIQLDLYDSALGRPVGGAVVKAIDAEKALVGHILKASVQPQRERAI